MGGNVNHIESYINAGFHLVELAPRDKAPTSDGWRDTSAERIDLSKNNVGIQLGKKSNGIVDIDLDCDEAQDLAKSLLPHTGAVFGRGSKPRSHYLYYVRPYPERFSSYKFVDPNTNENILEIRGDGMQTMMPPSVHPSGETVEWDDMSSVAQLEADQLRQYVGRLATAVLISRYWMEGIRHDTTLSLAGALFRAGWSCEMVEEYVEVIASYVGDEQISDHKRGIRDTYKKYEDGEPTTGWPKLAKLWSSDIVGTIREWLGLSKEPLYALTDTGNAERFFDQHEDSVRWVPEWNRWVIWTGSHWKRDEHLRIRRLAIDSVKSIENEANFVTDPEFKGLIFKWASNSQGKTRLDSMLELAKAFLAMPAEDFDTYHNLLNFENGTVDLKTGIVFDHDRSMYLTRVAPTNYNPDAKAPVFEKVVMDLVMGREDVYEYLQIALGYSVTGLTVEDVFFILYGPGRNGKSTVLETVSYVLGDYAKSARAETFFDSNGIPSDLAMLAGSRFVAAAETESGQKISDALVKRLTGGDKILARFLYGEWFEFDPTFKIWLATNHKPTISTQSLAIWERVRLIPCENVIPKSQRDPGLRQHLREIETEGIARWLVEGAMRWYANGLGNTPDEVEEATDEYRKEMDIIGDFIDEVCNEGGNVPANDLYKAYVSWAREQGRPVFGSRRFTSEMKEAGYKTEKIEGKNTFPGISLKENIGGTSAGSNPFGNPLQ